MLRVDHERRRRRGSLYHFVTIYRLSQRRIKLSFIGPLLLLNDKLPLVQLVCGADEELDRSYLDKICCWFIGTFVIPNKIPIRKSLVYILIIQSSNKNLY